jgi:hypothetical protein
LSSSPDKPFFSFLEAAIGFEPMNNGFADRCLSHLAMPPIQRNRNNRDQTGSTGLTGLGEKGKAQS